MPEVLAFMQGLWAVVHRMERLSKQMGAGAGVTGPQRLVIRLIGLFPGVSAGDLAAILHLHPSTLAGAGELRADAPVESCSCRRQASHASGGNRAR